MDVLSLLTGLRQAALRNPELRRALLATAQSARSLKDFCRIARASGFEFYEMDLLSAGEDLAAVMKRSVNGGGENSPDLPRQEDYYESFLASLEG